MLVIIHVYLTTTKRAGNQDGTIRRVSDMRQRNNESFTNAKETYVLLDTSIHAESVMATTFIQGLDSSKYSAFLTYSAYIMR